MGSENHQFPMSIVTEKEKPYLADNHNAFNASMNYDNHFRCTYWNNPKPFDSTKNWNRKTIAIIRPAGIGDVLFCTPIMHEIKRKWPECIITFCCMSRYWPILDHNPDVTMFLTYPTPYTELSQNDAIITFEGMLERSKAKIKHAIELAADYCEIPLSPDNLRTRYFLQDQEKEWAKQKYPRTYRKRLGIQWHTSCGTRNWDFKNLEAIMQIFAVKHDWEVFVFGENGCISIANCHPNVQNMAVKFFNIRESAALMSTCDVFLGMDSGLTHLAGALSLKTLAIYGSYNAAFRIDHQPTIKALQGRLPCAPCYSRDFLPNAPCWPSKRCEAMAQITPELVENEILKMV